MSAGAKSATRSVSPISFASVSLSTSRPVT
jgi:hypothetical protein